MTFIFKLHETGNDRMLAIADFSLVGKTLKSETHISEEFYGTEKCDKINAIKLARTASIINAFGNEIIELLVKNNIVEKNNAIEIDGVMHAQLVVL